MRIISGKFAGRILKTIQGEGYRPAMSRVREALFSILESRGLIWKRICVLDLFAGSASLAFEALSRGAEEILCVELNSKVAKVINKNAVILGLSAHECKVLVESVSRVLSRPCLKSYDLVFIDPPYKENEVKNTLKLLEKNKWLNQDAFVCAEVEARTKIDLAQLSISLELVLDRKYGQTRVLLWKNVLKSEEKI